MVSTALDAMLHYEESRLLTCLPSASAAENDEVIDHALRSGAPYLDGQLHIPQPGLDGFASWLSFLLQLSLPFIHYTTPTHSHTMPGVPEQPKPREENKSNKHEEKEVDSGTQTDDQSKDGGTLSPDQVEKLKKDPKVVVHCELQEELDKEFEQRGLHFDQKKSSDGDKGDNSNDKQSAGDDKAEQRAA